MPLEILGTDHLAPRGEVGPIGDGRRPRRGEDALILDREVHLQHLAPVGGVEVPRPCGRRCEFSLALRSMASLASS